MQLALIKELPGAPAWLTPVEQFRPAERIHSFLPIRTNVQGSGLPRGSAVPLLEKRSKLSLKVLGEV